jgi:hypothetical protein
VTREAGVPIVRGQQKEHPDPAGIAEGDSLNASPADLPAIISQPVSNPTIANHFIIVPVISMSLMAAIAALGLSL